MDTAALEAAAALYMQTHPTPSTSTPVADKNVSFTVTSADIKPKRIYNTESKAVIPSLAHHLDRVLFNPGVIHRLKDDRSNTFNFDHRLRWLPKPDEIAMDLVSVFVRPSEDPNLVRLLP